MYFLKTRPSRIKTNNPDCIIIINIIIIYTGALVAQRIVNPPSNLQESFGCGFEPRHWRPDLMEGLKTRDSPCRGLAIEEKKSSQSFIFTFWTSSSKQGDLQLSGAPSGQTAGGGARTRNRRVPADLRADSLA
ncbi:hypothetical protein PoB_004505600 [Plakobranchus ocellatus]|uniref:Uncharacterized protein n=1 Tax=Plakobranchus ocellatus TaxID=259542 RepID=A0AAV4B587_9GAST|nr:hypothetical protein PoB_004505600 [Plakobranchus ocellatus]